MPTGAGRGAEGASVLFGSFFWVAEAGEAAEAEAAVAVVAAAAAYLISAILGRFSLHYVGIL